MKVTAINYPEFHERMARLRELDLGLDGAICAGGGEVRVHLPYIAACNQTLYNRITSLAKQNKTELIVRNLPLAGVQLIVDYCYSGEMVITNDNFEHMIDAALGLEFLNIAEDCVQFALETNANANIWCHFLRAAFKHPRSVQPKEFVPNLILDNITRIPKEAVIKGLDAAYIREILDSGKVVDTNKCYTINVFLEILLADKGDIENFKDSIYHMRDTVDPGDTLTIPKETNDRSVLALTKLGLEMNFTSLVKACVEAMMNWPPSANVTSQVLQWMKQHISSDSVSYLNEICFHAFTNLPLDIPEDDICLMLDSTCLAKMSELDIFKRTYNWIQHNNASIDTKCHLISLIRFGLMTKQEMDVVFTKFPIQGCGDLFVSAMRYHLQPHEQPLTAGTMNKMRRNGAAVYFMGGSDSANNYNKSIYMSEAIIEKGNITLSPFTELCETPAALLHSGCTALNGFAFLSGGHAQSGDCISTLWRFDPRSKTWLELEQMGHKRARHTLTAMTSTLVAVGGVDGWSSVSAETYDVASNTWVELAPLPEGMFQHAATYVDGILYVSGGKGGKSLRCPTRDVWDTKSPMLHARTNHNMNSVSGMLFVAGGSVEVTRKWKNVTSAECYDISQNQWTELSPPTLPCSFGGSARVGNWFYLLGGYSQERKSRLHEIQKYDIETNTWEICDNKLPMKLCDMCSACV